MSLLVTDPAAAAVSTPVVADPAIAAVPAFADRVDPAIAAAAAQAAPTAVAPVAAPAAPMRPEGLPDALWDATTGVKTTEALARLAELETSDAARRAGVPADAAGYKMELAEPMNGPDGKPIVFNQNDPMAKGAMIWAHENGISQAGLSKLLGVFASNEMATINARNDRVAVETALLGPNVEARFTAVRQSLTAAVGEAGGKAIMASLGTAAAVEGMEKLIKSLAGPSVGTPPAGGASAKFEGLSGLDLLSAIRAQG